MLETLVAGIFSITNTFRIVAYIPQILRLAREPMAAHGVASSTWLMFFASHVATVAYAVIIVRDVAMAIVFLGNAIACALIVGLTLWRKQQRG